MKKTIYSVFVIFAAFIFAASCTKEVGNAWEEKGQVVDTTPAEPFSITVTIPQDMTKISFEQENKGEAGDKVKLTWDETDELVIVDNGDPTVSRNFIIPPSGISVDGKTATFTMKDGQPAMFTPSNGKYDVLYGAASLEEAQAKDYSSQTQTGNASLDVLENNYIALVSGVNTIENVELGKTWAEANGGTFKETGIIRLWLQMPTGVESIASVTLNAPSAIFYKSNALQDTEKISSMKLAFSGNASTENVKNTVTGYLMMPWEDVAFASDTDLSVIVQTEAGAFYSKAFTVTNGTKFDTGCVNAIKISKTGFSENTIFAAGAGTAADPWLIANKVHMGNIAANLAAGDETKYFKMVDDVDMSGVSWSYLNASSPYKVIDFDGNGKTIRNLGGSMFYVFKGAVRNLTLDSPSVTAGTQKGVFATYIQGTNNTLTNVKIQNVASFEGSSGNCGGMVGRINSGSDGYPTVTFDGCVVSNVPVNSGGTSAGGFIGSVEAKVVMNNCIYTGANVTNTSTTSDKGYAGGLIGFASAEVSITSSKVVNAKIAGYDAIGGMIGNINSGGFGNLTSCSVKADVSGRNYIGGFIGRERIASGVAIAISKCSFESYEDGVSGTNQYVGGIIGNQYGSGTVTIENSYVNSPVIATDAWAGGISGNHYNGTLTIGRCYVMGSVSAKYGAGGIVGQVRVANLTINPCAVYVSSISATATDSDPHESSGTIVAYGYNVNVTIARNCWYDQMLSFTECLGNYGSPSTWPPAREGGLSNAKISGGTPHSKIYPYWGRYTNPSDYPLNRMCKEILECSSDIWNLDVNPPILK